MISILNSRKHLEVSFLMRSYIGKYPLLYYPLYNVVPKNRRLSVNPNTHLVIEGFPRSANTFAVVAFEYANSGDLHLAHHMHVPAQIIKAARLKVPAIVVIRNPKDAVVSFCIRDKRIVLQDALRCYISFYSRVYSFRNSYVLAHFDEVVKDLGGVIDKVNTKFGTKFNAFTPTGQDLENIFNEISDLEGGAELKVSRPSESRSEIKTKFLQDLEEPKFQKLVTKAESVYSKFIGSILK